MEEKTESSNKSPKEKAPLAIKSSVSIHEKTQLETVFSYDFSSITGSKKHKNLKYRVDGYLFLAPQMNIGPHNYSKEHFYSDLKVFLRFREPRLNYRELLGLDLKSINSTTPSAHNRIDTAEQSSCELDTHRAIEDARLFACSFAGYFRRRVERRKRKIVDNQKDDLKFEKHCQSAQGFLQHAFLVLQGWRQLKNSFANNENAGATAIAAEINLVDEYCSYVFRNGLYRFLSELQHSENRGQYSKNLYRKIIALLRFERWYCKKANFLWLTINSDSIEKETFNYRKSCLKKRIWSVLYLNPRPEVFWQFRKQLGPMIAAGIAAGWAILTSLLIWSFSSFQGYGFVGALSASSLALVIAGFIISYVLKDRIKELGRVVFTKGILRKNPDLSNQIYYEQGSKRLSIGRIDEFVGFVKKEKISRTILDAKQKHEDPLLDQKVFGSGSIIHYAKIIELKASVLKKIPHPISFVSDITRLNVESFLPKLSEPVQRAFVSDGISRVESVLLPKTYHLDMIFKYSPYKGPKYSSQMRYEYYRLTVNKRGLTRIDQLM